VIPYGGSSSETARGFCQALAECLSASTVEFGCDAPGGPDAAIGPKMDSGRRRFNRVNLVSCDDERANAAARAIELAARMIEEAERFGFSRGSSILGRLASGEITTKEFDERMEKKK